MGVDYSGHYGLGFAVQLPVFTEDHEFYEDERTWLDEIEEDDFFWFETGARMYDENDNGQIYICIHEPFENGLDITEKVNKLKGFLNKHEIMFDGEIDVVGGLEIY